MQTSTPTRALRGVFIWVVFFGGLAPLAPEAFGNKTSVRVRERAERLERVEQEQLEQERIETEAWPTDRVLLNMSYRVPIHKAAGFCLLQATADQDASAFIKEMRGLQNELQALAQSATVVGRDLPPAMARGADQLRNRLYDAIDRHFGTEVRDTFRTDLRRQRAALKPRGDTLVSFRNF
ncbi:MAG: hypothetical protein ACFB20_05565 [Opitutales bacterium]